MLLALVVVILIPSLILGLDLEYIMQLERIQCRTDICQNLTCKLVFLSHGKREPLIECTLPYKVNVTKVHFTLYAKNGQIFQPFLIDVWEEPCEHLKNFKPLKHWHSKNIMEFLSQFLKKYTNAIHPCPHEGIFYVKNMTFPLTARFLQFMPSNRYRVDAIFYDPDNRTALSYEAFVTVSSRGPRVKPRENLKT